MIRKTISILMVLALFVSLFAFASAVEPYSIGDVDGNGQILADDARLALRASAKLEELTEQQKTAADVDGSGEVLADDARVILRVSAKLEPVPGKPGEIPAKPASPNEVLKATGMQTGYDTENKVLYYHFTLSNTSKYYSVSFPGIMVETTGEEGGFDFPIIESIRPGEVIELVGMIYGMETAPSGAKVTIYSVTNYDDNGNSVPQTVYTLCTGEGSFGALEVTNVRYFQSGVGGKITGTIRNNNSYNVMTASVYVLRTDGSGKILSVDGLETKDSPVTGIPAGKNAAFELAAEADIGKNDRIVVCTDGSETDDTFEKVSVDLESSKAALSSSSTLGVVFNAKNSDMENAIYAPQFRVTAYGAKNASGERTVLGVGYVTAQVIAPGTTLKITAEACTVDIKNERIEVFNIRYVGCSFADKPASGYKDLTTFGMEVGKDELGTKVLSGFVSNPNGNKVKDVTVCLAVYSETGTLLYVNSAMVEEIEKKESAPVDIPVDNDPYRYEVMVLSWSDVTE